MKKLKHTMLTTIPNECVHSNNSPSRYITNNREKEIKIIIIDDVEESRAHDALKIIFFFLFFACNDSVLYACVICVNALCVMNTIISIKQHQHQQQQQQQRYDRIMKFYFQYIHETRTREPIKWNIFTTSCRLPHCAQNLFTRRFFFFSLIQGQRMVTPGIHF